MRLTIAVELEVPDGTDPELVSHTVYCAVQMEIEETAELLRNGSQPPDGPPGEIVRLLGAMALIGTMPARHIATLSAHDLASARCTNPNDN